MTQLQDQFSAVRKASVEAQFDFFNSMTTQAIESASRVAALNLAVSRDAVQRSLGAGFALMSSRDPRDVLSLGSQAEEQMRSLLTYGRELMGIASGMRPYAGRPQALASASQQAVDTVEVIERSAVAQVEAAADTAAAAAPAVTQTAAQAVSQVVPARAEAVVVAEPEPASELLAAVAEPVPVAEPKAIAKAIGNGAPRAAAAPHPAAAPMESDEGAEAVKVELPAAPAKRKK